jgi:protein gp37
MYFLDRARRRHGSEIYRTKGAFNYPLQKKRDCSYKVQSGETVRVCMTSDFFLAEADKWRAEAWQIMRSRPDVIFFLLTKRPERVAENLPPNWNGGWENIFFNVTAENQRRADERIPLLLKLPFKHKGVFVAPFIGSVSIAKYLKYGQIEQVVCGGENYDGARACNFDWVKSLYAECKAFDVSFSFIETGTNFIKDGKQYYMPSKRMQSEMAFKSKMHYQGKAQIFKLTDIWGREIPKERLYEKSFLPHCAKCGSRLICNGCSGCGKCEDAKC